MINMLVLVEFLAGVFSALHELRAEKPRNHRADYAITWALGHEYLLGQQHKHQHEQGGSKAVKSNMQNH